ncbi:Juvenile hormone-binding protein [Eumeta japonica]|uniref:Juvenile hormone-binding protein n=1 Tax=Eumeta variegata TaxID=151549 RepID=A0A4C1YTQ0_EUMVA|nr:Juvenile hormone-binding protein [Eumeta japonica]
MLIPALLLIPAPVSPVILILVPHSILRRGAVVNSDPRLVYDLSSATDHGSDLNEAAASHRMDLTTKHVQLTMRMNLDVEGQIKIKHENEEKSYSGSYRATVKLVTVSSYDYEMTIREGVEHYEVLPETLKFDYEDISFLLSDDLNGALTRDGKSDYTTPEHSDNYNSIVMNLLVDPAHTIINNLREAARRLPKSAFFTDV